MRCLALSAAVFTILLPLQAQPESHPEGLVKHPPPQSGLAPKLKVTEFSHTRNFELVFSKGDDVHSGLADFALAHQIHVAHFTAVGALDHAVLGWSEPGKHAFKTTVLNQEVEIVGFSGSVSVVNGKPNVHVHAVVALPDGSTRGGDLLEGRVSLTLQLFLEDAVPETHLGENAPSNGYEEVAPWPIEMKNAAGTPAPWNLIQVSGVAAEADGRVLVLHRGAHPILEFDASGNLLRSFGDGLFSEGKVAAIEPRDLLPNHPYYSAVYGVAGCDSCGAHMIRVDPDQNIWAIDAPGNVIYKMNPQGKILLTLGHKGVTGAGHDTFNLPTDVAFAPNGDFYVTDGYAGARVVKFSRDGKYLLEWGRRGEGPGEFELPHNIAVDAQGRVYVSDRQTKRIEIFDADGKFLTQWPTQEGVSGLFLTPDQHLWAGAVELDLNGNPIARLPNSTASGPHAVTVAPSGDVYLGQLSGKVQKFVKH